MVAIVTGNGTGLERSSAWVLGSRGQLGSAPLGRDGEGVYVNAANGNLVITRQDEFLIGLGPDASIDRTYNSQAAISDGDNGDNWRMGVYRKVTGLSGDYGAAGTTVTRIDWDGSETLYTWNATYIDATHGAYVAKDGAGAYDMLTRSGDIWTWTDGSSQVTELYDQARNGLITTASDTDGNCLTYTYDIGTGLITRVTSQNGASPNETIDLIYDGTKLTQLITTKSDGTLTRVRYTYETYNGAATTRLTSVTIDLSPHDSAVTDGIKYVTTYTYEDNSSTRVASITQQDGSHVAFVHTLVGSTYKVTSYTQTVAAGVTRTTSFDYSVAGRTTITDPAEQKTIFWYNSNNELTQISYPPEGAAATPRVVQFAYDLSGDGDVTSVTLGPGNVSTYNHDARGNLILERDGAGNTIKRTYSDPKNELLTETRYLVPDPDGGGGDQPGTPLTTRYVYDDASNLRFVVSAEGLVTEYQYETNPGALGFGQQEIAIENIAHAYVLDGLGPEDLISLATLTAWMANVTDKSTTRRTETSYDPRGAVATVTSYSKLLSSGEFDTSSELSRTTYTYDTYGNLLTRTVHGSAASEVFVHDGLGRTIIATDFNGAVTRTSFLDSLGQTVLTHANGLSEVSSYNRAGELIAFSESNAGGNLVDATGWPGNPGSVPSGYATLPGWMNASHITDETRWASTMGPDGLQVVAMQAGQLDASLEGGGNHTQEITIDASKAYEFTWQFKLSAMDKHHVFFGLSGAAPAYVENLHDGVDNDNPYFWYAYPGMQDAYLDPDKWYKVVGYVLPQGTPTSSTPSGGVYDVATGQKVLDVHMNFRWNPERPGNTVHSRFFDFYGIEYQDYSTYFLAPEVRQVSTASVLGPDAATSLYRYDNLGRLRMTVDPTGRRNYMMYDSIGRKVADIDADGSVIEYRYDGSDNLTSTTRYANRLSSGQLASLVDGNGNPTSAAFASLRPSAHSEDQWTFQVYDAAQRLIQTIDGTGATSVFTYDGASRLVATKQFANKLSATTLASLQAEATSPNIWNYPNDGTAWPYANLTRAATGTTIDGAPAYQFSVITSGQHEAFANGMFTAYAGDIFSYTISIKAVGSVTTNWLGIYSYNPASWGGTSDTYAAIASGPGTLSRWDGSLFVISGLSTAEATRITITRKTLQNELVAAYFYVKTPDPAQVVAGDSVIAAAPVFLRSHSTAINLPTADAAKDRSTRNFYDNDGRMTATLDGAGGLTQFVYDKGGRKIRELGAAKVADSSLWAAGTLAQLISSVGTSASDRSADYVYDARGFLRFTIDATARPIETVYDGAGRIIRTVEYAGSIASAASYSLSYVTAQLSSTGLATNANNRITRSVYDAAGQLLFGIDAIGALSAFAYDNVGNVTKQTRYANPFIAAGDQSLATMQAWAAGEAANASNRISRTVYDLFGRAAYTVDGEGYVSERQYDRADRVTKEIRYAGVYTVSDGVTKASLAAQIGAPPGTAVIVTYAYDADGRLSDTVDGTGAVTHFAYDSHGQVIDTVATYGTADASTTRRAYDLVGRVVSETRAHGTTIAATTGFAYDALGNLTDVTDPRGYTTTRIYDTLGRVLTVSIPVDATLANNLVTTHAYDAFGNLAKVTDARGFSSFNYYDAIGRMVLQSDNEEFITAISYTVFGEVYQTTRCALRGTGTRTITTQPTVNQGAADATTTFTYDRMSRLKSVTDAQNHVESYSYDAFGDRFQTVNKTNGVTEHIFDRLGRMRYEWVDSVAHRPDGSVQSTGFYKTILEYDFRGNVSRKVEAYGLTERRDTHYGYDKNGRLTLSYMLPLDTIGTDLLTIPGVWPEERLTYNLRGDLIQSVDLGGGKTISYYDALGRKTDEVGPTGTLSHWTYHANGNVSAKVYGDPVAVPALPTHPRPDPIDTANYRETSYVYDHAGQLTTTTVAGLRLGVYNGSAYSTYVDAVTTSRSYDKAGNVILEYDGVGYAVRSYYDALNRKVAEVDREDFLTVWTRDANGNATVETRYAQRVASPPAQEATVAQLVALAGGGDAGADRTTTFEYDRNGRRTWETRLGVAVATASGPLSTTIQSAAIRYHYNGLGLVTRKTEANDTFTDFEYDNSGRLFRVTEAAFTDHEGAGVRPTTESFYDGLGNVVRTEVNRQSGASADDRVTTYSYGAAGKLLSTTDAAGFTRTFGYDVAGRVVKESWQRTKSDGTTLLTEAIGYRYDLAGRLISQAAATWNGSAWLFGEATRIRYNAYGEVTGKGVTGGPNDAAVYQEEYRYDKGGRMWRSTGEDGTVKLYVHNRNGAVTLAIASTGTDLSANSIDQAIARLTNGGANTVGAAAVAGVTATIFTYYRRGELGETHEPFRELSANGAGGFNMATLSASRTSNAFGEVVSKTDARGYVTDFAYNAMGRLIEKKSPSVSWTSEAGATASARPAETYFYDISGRLVGIRDANGSETRRELLAGTGHGGGEALVTAEFHSDSGVFRTWYDAFRDARLIRNELNPSATPTYSAASDERRAYDKMGRLVTVEQRGGLLTDSYVYDGLGRRTRHTNSFLGTSNAEHTDYDVQGRVTDTVAFGGDTTHIDHVWSSAIANAGLTGAGIAIGGWITTTTYVNGKSLVETSDLFGHAIARTDLGEHAFTYGYDRGGRLTSQAVGGETLTYAYYNSGRAASVSNGAGNSAAYGYDEAGNLVSEKTIKSSLVVQNATATFDALGRLVSWAEAGGTVSPAASIAQEYDLVGNIRHTGATFHYLDGAGNAAGSAVTSHYWFRYDSMNRVVVDKGMLSSSQIVRGTGTDYSYDAAGRRATATRNASLTKMLWRHSPSGGGGQSWWEYQEDLSGGTWAYLNYNYSGARRETYSYGVDGTLESVRTNQDGVWARGFAGVQITAMGSGAGVLAGSFTYDAMKRLTHQIDWKEAGTDAVYDRQVAYNSKGQINTDTAFRKETGDIFTNAATNHYGSGSGYHLGAVEHMVTANSKNSAAQSTVTTTNAYTWWDGAAQGSTNVVTDYVSGSDTNDTTTFSYGASGQLTSVYIGDGRARTVTFVTDMAGQVIRRDEADTNETAGDPHEIRYRYGGRELGYTGNNGSLDTDYTASIENRIKPNGTGNGAFRFAATSHNAYADFGQGLDPVNSYEQGSGGGSYTARAGDTLASIAAMLWGDASLWYKLAEANGLSGPGALAEGRSLILPSGMMSNAHNASTFKPYDAAEALGDLSPNAPKPAKKAGKCAVIGQILMVVIAVAVSAVVAPWATGLIAGQGATLLGGIAAAMAGGAIGGAAGAIASQAVGVATGLQSKFDWKGVGMAAIGGAIGGGLGKFGALAQATKITGNLGKIGSFLSGGGAIGGAANGVLSNVLSQGIGVATGLQDKFSWVGVAAAGAGGGAGGWTGNRLGELNTHVAQGLSSAAGAMANAAARSLIEGSNFGDNLIAALPDVIGGTIGNLIVAGVQGSGSRGLAEKAMPKSAADISVTGSGNSTETDAQYEARQAARDAEFQARYDAEDAAAAAAASRTGPTLVVDDSRSASSLEELAAREQRIESLNSQYGPYENIGALREAIDYDRRRLLTAASVKTIFGDPGWLPASAFTGDGSSITSAPTGFFGWSGWGHMAYAFRGARAQFVGDITQPHSLRVMTGGPYAHLGNALNLAFAPLSAGIQSAVRPLWPDTGDIVSTRLRADALARNPWDIGLVGTNAGRRALFADMVIGGLTARAPLGLMRGGTAAGDVAIHGNSRLSTRTAYLYRLNDLDGNLLKWGITQNEIVARRYTRSFLSDKLIFRVTSGSRSDMLALERQYITQMPGPLNMEPWAVAARRAGRGQ